MTYYCYKNSPIGTLLLTGTDEALKEIHFPNELESFVAKKGAVESEAPFREVIEQLQEYFDGKRRTFSISLAPSGTDFQQRVWRELQKIEYGATSSYGEVAQRIGNANASRAVGMANGKNPIPIIIPCHRVIGKDGSLTGFGGGLEIKRHLLDLEHSSQAD
jgi:methylated-DNA-[protein]-cysteine S-methyltransferase